ncbi:MAG TPA: nicotinate-nucleotide adenylyltransferase [Capillibacterium sp.]
MNRIGIYGGSFDPIHLGHLLLAEAAREELRLDQVIFVPALQSPLKDHPPLVRNEDRLELVKLAIADNPFFTVSAVELERKPPSYTVDTLLYFHRVYPGREFFLLMGQDALNTLPAWRNFPALFTLACVTVGLRPGFSPAWPPELEKYRIPSEESKGLVFFHNPQVEISSSQIRERLHSGKSVRYWLTPAVLDYILRKKLYI